MVISIIHQMKGDYETALKLHKTHLSIAQELSDYAAQGRAYGNMGNAFNALGIFDQAVKYHRQELQISMEVNDRASQASTHGNLAVAYQALGAHDRALQHYQNHLNIARELRDIQSEARALSNLGNFHCSRGEFLQAVPYYEQYLRLPAELQDMESEGKVCHNLGYAHYCLRNYQEAVKFYEQDLALAKDLHDKLSQAKAYCNLGLAFKALGNYNKAEECQKYLLSLAQSLNNSQARFRALGNLGDIFVCKKDVNGAIKFYEQQLALAHQVKERKLEASAYAALGAAYRLIQKYDKALGYHTQELEVYQELSDIQGECKAHGHLAAVYMSLGKYTMAFKCYEEQLELGQKLKDPSIEAQVYGNMGITKMNMNVMEEAIGYFEQQLAMLQQLNGNEAVLDRGRGYGNLGDCYEALGDYEEAIKYYEQYLSVAQSLNRMQDQAKAYRGLGNGHRAMGSLQQALVCFEKRLVVAHELGESFNKAQAYGELGSLHSQLGNYEQAISCLERQLNIAREVKDRILESAAACGLGGVYQHMGEYDTALQYHQLDLEISEETNNPTCQGRAYGNLGLTYESLGNFERAVVYQEQHLSIAAQMNDLVAKTVAYSSLGRTHHALQNYSQAVMYLQEGLRLAEQLGRREDEAKIRHRLGLSLWASRNLEEAQHQLYRASALFETIRHEAQHSTDYKLSLFDLQTSCYQALQRVLVTLGHHDEALAVAERGRTRAFVDLLVERQTGQQDSDPYSPVTIDQILETVNSQRGLVLYYSLAAGYLYSWLLAPGAGILKFHEVYLGEGLVESSADPHESSSMSLQSVSSSTLEQYISNVREALGIESHYTRPCSSSETESEAGDLLDQQFEELHNKLNSVTDPTGFLRMVSRNNLFNRPVIQAKSWDWISGNRAIRFGLLVTAAVAAQIYDGVKHVNDPFSHIIFFSVQRGLMHSSGPVGRHRQLILVLEGELYLIPFALLKGSSSNEYLYERFSLIAIPSIQSLSSTAKSHSKKNAPTYSSPTSMAAVIGNPKLPSSIMDRWLWGPMPSAEEEAYMVSELLGCQPLVGPAATKERVMSALSQAECVHFATHMSWKLAALVLTPNSDSSSGGGGGKGSYGNSYTIPESLRMQDDASDVESITDSPPLQEFLLTAADILDLRLPVKLVVLGSYQESNSKVTADGVIGLTRAFLAAGAQCVLVSLWSVPVAASKMFVHSFYSALLNGMKASAALADAMKTVQSSKQFSHPSNWAGRAIFPLQYCLLTPVQSHSKKNAPTYSSPTSMAAVIGNPKLPSSIMDRWLWGPMPSAEEEAYMVSELLGCQPLVGPAATKERVMSALSQAECVHFATHMSWKLAALVLTPNSDGSSGGGGGKGSYGNSYTIPESLRMQDDASDVESITDSPPLQEFLLTAADILDLRLPVKLVVLGSYQESNSKVTADGVIGLTRAFLAAGAQCVLVSLWPVPVAASKMFVHAFYSALLNGMKASAALADAMKTVQSSKQFSHPSNWAGFMLIGSDVKLNSPSSLIGQALSEILQHPERARDSLRVLLHLVEKSLQRIQNGQRNSMYTSQQSVENKVGGVPGWQALLTAVGFRLDPTATGLPAAVFFPIADPGDRLQQCSTTLQSLLGFDLCEVGQEEVVLKTGKQANRRTMHFALQSLLALFDSTELPKRLSLDSSSSLESLASAQSVSNPMPLGYPNPPFSPTCPDSMASDAISVYSLSSIASSMSFVSKAESTSEYMSHRGRQDYERGKMFYSQKTSVPRSRSSPHANITANKDDEEYEGFSIISNEPLAGNSDSLPLPDSHKLLKGNERMSEMARACYGASVSSRGSVSTPTSPIKMTLIPSQNSPFQKVGKLPSSDTGESDQSSTETDSTVKSQEEKTTKLDPQELAQKILEETQSHLIAVECLQRSGSQTSCVSEPIGGASTPTGGSAFRSSEMSAFSRPHSASLKSQSSPVTVRPKPPSRTSSLQKVSSGYNSPATSETSLKDGSSQPSPTTDPHSLAQFKLKYPTSPYSTHISRSPSNISPSSGHQSPSVSNPSPDLSYSSTGSARSSPADAPDLDRLKLAALDEKVQAIHNLKTFWTNTSQHPSGPVRALRGNIGASKRDVLSLLNLSPRHSKREKGTNNLELKELAIQQVELTSPQKNPPNGHKRPETNKVVAPSPSASASSSPGGRPLRLPSGNGYKFLSPGRFFPSSKC
ncbi:Tetratricopeptide repeat protein 28 [Acipenser ruthenus]|uniref:Tetratricopeptide repeat protein 28 n=1 Tax=Acipenser ruthenus TaxID=7906 RepID=A0A662YS19_ACIRT|nr:Tetratricopeptide repeat protein 28 [Acipenser ruthenus]